MKLRIGYPGRLDELAMLAASVGTEEGREAGSVEPIGHGRLRALQEHVAGVAVGPMVAEYLVDLAAATRGHRQVTLGLSPRGLLTWQRLAQAHAFLDGRTFATPDDVQALARPVLDVRLGIEPEAADRVVSEILESVPVPVYPKARRA
jgi:MoxR-like ATPase